MFPPTSACPSAGPCCRPRADLNSIQLSILLDDGAPAAASAAGTLANGTEFDSSRKRGDKFSFKIGKPK